MVTIRGVFRTTQTFNMIYFTKIGKAFQQEDRSQMFDWVLNIPLKNVTHTHTHTHTLKPKTVTSKLHNPPEKMYVYMYILYILNKTTLTTEK